MIAPVNCNPDCDCAQRMVRCQRAAPVERAFPSDENVHRLEETVVAHNVFLDQPPPYVIPASLATNAFQAATETYKNEPDHFIDALRELEKEFPATMGIAPTDEAPIPLAGTEFLTVTSKYDGACGPWMLVGYDRTVLRHRLIHAFRACELDCGMWSDNALAELADIAIETLEAK